VQITELSLGTNRRCDRRASVLAAPLHCDSRSTVRGLGNKGHWFRRFRKSTGESVLTKRRGRGLGLSSNNFPKPDSDQRIRQTLGLMRQAPDIGQFRVAREVCERTGSVAVLKADASLEPNTYSGTRTAIPAISPMKSRSRRQEKRCPPCAQQNCYALERASGMLAMIERHSTPLEQATTPPRGFEGVHHEHESEPVNRPSTAIPISSARFDRPSLRPAGHPVHVQKW
jgi:hypothetical protein